MPVKIGEVMTYDWVIIGAGCAGLALANALHRHGYAGRLLILEARKAYTHDRTWCYWARHGSPEHEQGEWSWDRLVFSSRETGWLHHQYHDWCYVCLSSQTYYQRSFIGLELSPFDFELDQQVIAIDGSADEGFCVQTQTHSYNAKQVMDTRFQLHDCVPLLYQKFIGREYRLSQPIKHSNTVRLMCDMHAKSGGIMFYYLLPFSAEYVLVEPTGFQPKVIKSAVFEPYFSTIFDIENLQVSHQVREETGILPMGLQSQTISPNRHYGGIGGGALRASSGYGFLRIQRWAQDTASRIVFGRHLNSVYPEPRLQAVLDQLFLTIIRKHPARASQIFLDLMSGKDQTSFLKMMRDEASLCDWGRLMVKLPKSLFLKEAVYALCAKQKIPVVSVKSEL